MPESSLPSKTTNQSQFSRLGRSHSAISKDHRGNATPLSRRANQKPAEAARHHRAAPSTLTPPKQRDTTAPDADQNPQLLNSDQLYILPSGYTDNMTTPRLSIHDRLTDLADATRCRILLALESHELTVGELCAALQLPQSTVSRHLKILADEAWLSSRADGASRWYKISTGLDPAAASLWQLVRAPLASTPAADQDLARVTSVLAARRARSEAFFAGAAPDWDSTRSSLF